MTYKHQSQSSQKVDMENQRGGAFEETPAEPYGFPPVPGSAPVERRPAQRLNKPEEEVSARSQLYLRVSSNRETGTSLEVCTNEGEDWEPVRFSKNSWRSDTQEYLAVFDGDQVEAALARLKNKSKER